MVTKNSMSLDTHPVPELSGQQRRCHVLLMLYAPLPAVQLETISQINGTDLPTTRQDIAEVNREIQRLHHLDILAFVKTPASYRAHCWISVYVCSTDCAAPCAPLRSLSPTILLPGYIRE